MTATIGFNRIVIRVQSKNVWSSQKNDFEMHEFKKCILVKKQELDLLETKEATRLCLLWTKEVNFGALK